MKRIDLAYIAGIFDGEGTIHIARGRMGRKEGYLYSMHVSLGLTNEFIPRWLQLCFGGSVSIQHAKEKDNHKDCYTWRVCAQTAIDFLNAVLPYLKLKSAQAKIAIEFQKNQKVKGKHIRLSDEETAMREVHYQALGELNKKGKYALLISKN